LPAGSVSSAAATQQQHSQKAQAQHSENRQRAGSRPRATGPDACLR
jgi:hypothetical protein